MHGFVIFGVFSVFSTIFLPILIEKSGGIFWSTLRFGRSLLSYCGVQLRISCGFRVDWLGGRTKPPRAVLSGTSDELR